MNKFMKKVFAVLVTLATVFTSGNLEQFGTVTAEAASQYGYASYTSHITGDIYYLYVSDTSTPTDTNLAFCGKRGTTLVHNVYRNGTSIPYSGKQLQILKAAWWIFDSKQDGTVNGLSVQVRYVVGRLMTWSVTNGGATTADGVIHYIKNNASSYLVYETQIRSILTRAFDGEFDGNKVTLYYYNVSSGDQQPMIQGTVNENVTVTITLQKTGTNTGSRANRKGAVYAIYDTYNAKTGKVSGKVAEMPATDKNGKSRKSFTNVLDSGKTYYVKEITAPTGCTLNSTVYTVTPKENETVAVNQKNDSKVYDKEKSIKVTVVKKDKDTKKALGGAAFTIYEWSAKKNDWVKASTDDMSGNSITITTNSKGKASTGKLYYTADNKGKWKLIESQAPAGYTLKDKSKTFSTKSNGETQEYTWTVNEKKSKGKIKIQKTIDEDAENNTGSNVSWDLRATYKVYSKKSCTKDSCVTTIKTNKKGVGTSSKISLDGENQTFYVKEVSAATGTDASTSKAISVTVKAGETAILTGKKQTTEVPWNLSVEVTKVDAKNNSKKLKGAVFTIYEWNGKKYVVNKNGGYSTTITTDSNGKATTPTLYYNNTNKGKYKIVETKAPIGYQLSGWSKKIIITSKNTNKVLYKRVTNVKKTGKISLSKAVQDYTAITAETGTFLDSTLYDFSGIQYGVYTLQGTMVDTITLNKSGNGTSKDLDEGTYYIKEVASTVPDTMVSTSMAGINATMQVTVTAGKTTNYTGANTTDGAVDKDGNKIDVDTFLGNPLINLAKTIDISVFKFDDETKTVLSGAVFTLYEWNSTTKSWDSINTYTSGSTGWAISDLKLKYTAVNQGKFKLVETKAPSGYVNTGYTKVFNFTDATKVDEITTITSQYKGTYDENTVYNFKDVVSIAKGGKLYYYQALKTSIGALDPDTLTGKEYYKDAAGSTWKRVQAYNAIQFYGSALTTGSVFDECQTTGRWKWRIEADTIASYGVGSLTSRFEGEWFIGITKPNPTSATATTTFDLSGNVAATNSDGCLYVLSNKKVFSYSADGYSKLMYYGALCNATTTTGGVSYTWYRGDSNTYSVTRTFTTNLFTAKPQYLPTYAMNSDGTIASKDVDEWVSAYGSNNKYVKMTDDSGTQYAAPFSSVSMSGTGSAASVEPTITKTSEEGFYDSMYQMNISVGNTANDSDKWYITLIKSDSKTGDLVTGATFTAVYNNGTKDVSATMTDNKDGTYTLSGKFASTLTSITFNIYETGTPTGYIEKDADDVVATLTVTKGASNTTTGNYKTKNVTNTPVTGTINGKKYDAVSKTDTAKGDATLEGAVYSLYSDPYCTLKVGEATTDAEGNFSFENVPITNEYEYGAYTSYNYYIKETVAPEGYELNDTVYVANLYTLWVRNKTQTSVSTTIKNKLTSIASGGAYAYSGTIAVTDLNDTEIAAPISIHKTATALDAEGEETESTPLAEAGFSLYQVSKLSSELDITDNEAVQNFDFSNEADAKVALTATGETEIFTDKNGDATTVDIPYGTYVLVETTVPDGYVLETESRQVVTITGNDQTETYEFSNQLYQASIEITKLDATDKEVDAKVDKQINTLEGTKFKIYKLNENGEWDVLTETVTEYDEDENEVSVTQEIEYEIAAVENEDGTVSYQVCTGLLTEGTYKVVETEAAPGYLLPEEAEQIIKVGSNENENKQYYTNGAEYYTLEYKDDSTMVDIKKTDFVTGEEIKGATLYITNDGGEEVARWVTDGTPYRIKALELGTYTLTEETAPDGYVIANSVEFTVEADGKIQVVEMKDYQIPVEISKTDMVTGEEIAGATLQLYTATNITYDEETGLIASYEKGELYKEWVTNGEKTTISGIPVGEYVLVETAAPDGYVISNEVQFSVTMPSILEDEDGNETGPEIQQVEMKDDITRLSISKLRSDSLEQLAGATMQVLDAETKEVVYEFTSTDNEQLFERVPAGDYILHEVSAPDGFLEAEDIPFTVEAISETQEVTMEDAPIYVRIKKVDENGTVLGYTTKDVPATDEATEDGDYVTIKVGEGAVLQILNSSNEVVKEWEVNADFEQEGILIAGLAPGEYTLHEVSAPTGYCTADDLKFTVAKTEEVKEVTMVDQSTKVDITKSDITGTKEIVGAKLTVYKILDEDTNELEEVETWTSTEEAHRIENLTFGKYLLREVLTPDGYATAEDIVFEITDNPEIQKVAMKDAETKLQINKVDQNGNTVTGATLALLDEDGNEVARFKTSETPYVISKLSVGKTYTVTEVVTPEGYLPAKDVSITIKDTADVQEITMIDYTTLKIPATGGTGVLPFVATGVILLLSSALYVLELKKQKRQQ